MQRMRLTGLLALAILGATCLPGAARADDKDAPLPLTPLRVSALTGGLEYSLPRSPVVDPADGHVIEGELDGSYAEEPLYPLGQVDELIELLKTEVQPELWESLVGAEIRSQGEANLFVWAPEPLARAVADRIAELERQHLRTAGIELLVLAVPRGGVPEDLEGWAANAAPLAASRLTAFDGQSVTAYSGRQHAYLSSHGLTVKRGVSSPEPVVAVANLGLIAHATVHIDALRHTPRLSLRVVHTGLEGSREVQLAPGRVIDAPQLRTLRVTADRRVEAGRWTVVGRGADRAVLARVESRRPAYGAQRAVPLRVVRSREGPMEQAVFDVRAFGEPSRSSWAGLTGLRPSRYKPPVPQELGEPAVPFPPENLVELIRAIGPEALWQDPARIEARYGMLRCRNHGAILDGIPSILARLRELGTRRVVVAARVLDLPADLALRVRGGADASGALLPETLAAITASVREGSSRLTGAVRFVVTPGYQVSAVTDGRSERYLGAFEHDGKACRSVLRELFEGVRLGVHAQLSGDGGHVLLRTQLQVSARAGAMRTRKTPAGTLELPSLDLLHTRSSAVVRDGATIVLAADGAGARRRVILLSARAARP